MNGNKMVYPYNRCGK